jgi:hypothetical protein
MTAIRDVFSFCVYIYIYILHNKEPVVWAEMPLTLHCQLSSTVVMLLCVLLIFHVHASLQAYSENGHSLEYGSIETSERRKSLDYDSVRTENVMGHLKHYSSTYLKKLRRKLKHLLEALVKSQDFCQEFL